MSKFIYIPDYYLSLYQIWNTTPEIEIEKTKRVAIIEHRNSENICENFLEIIGDEHEIDTIRNTHFENMVSKLSEYEFVIIIEDYISMGHVSDRIMAALKAHTIPLYFGSPDIEAHVKSEYLINLRTVQVDILLSVMKHMLQGVSDEITIEDKLVRNNYLLDNSILKKQLEYYINYYQK